MKMMMLCGLLSTLGACSAFSPVELRLPDPPIMLTAACPALQTNPGKPLQQAEAEVMWGRDRAAGRVCASRHAGLVDWVTGLVAEVGPQ
jgi:hypothetical protein